MKKKRLSLQYLWSYIRPKDTDVELKKVKSIKKQMSLTYSTKANLKVNEDAENFGIKNKD